MRQQQEHEELHQQTIEVLVKLVDVLSDADLALLRWHCGVSRDEIMPVEEEKYPDLFKRAA